MRETLKTRSKTLGICLEIDSLILAAMTAGDMGSSGTTFPGNSVRECELREDNCSCGHRSFSSRDLD